MSTEKNLRMVNLRKSKIPECAGGLKKESVLKVCNVDFHILRKDKSGLSHLGVKEENHVYFFNKTDAHTSIQELVFKCPKDLIRDMDKQENVDTEMTVGISIPAPSLIQNRFFGLPAE